jgi:UDP-glucose 4-epimerase
LDKALAGCDAVIHLAWSTVPKQTKGSTSYEFSSNINSSISLIEKCIDFNIDKFVFISSGGTVYGIPESIPIPEVHALAPISNYGLSKLTTEKLLHLYHYSNQLNYTVLRVSNAYGERQNFYKNQGVIGVWLRNICEKKDIEIWGDGSVVRDYVYVEDVATAIANALQEVNGASIYNIGGGEGVSLNEILSVIREVTGVAFTVNYKPARRFDVPINILDITQAKSKIGFVPSTSIQEGVSRTWKWICAQNE